MNPPKRSVMQEATEAFERGSLGRAESACRKHLKAHPKSTEALFLLALIHHERQEKSESIACYQKILRIAPSIIEARYNLGVLLLELKDYPKAEDCFRQALRSRPEYVTSLAQRTGFETLVLRDVSLRLQAGQPVPGQVYVFRKPGPLSGSPA